MREPAGRSWLHARARLLDFGLVTWAVDPDHVAARLPAGFAPIERAGAAFVSMVAFRTVRFRFGFAPFVAMTAPQVDYRTYVEREGASGIWSFAATLASPLVVVPRALWGMPWRNRPVEIDADWCATGCGSWSTRVARGAPRPTTVSLAADPAAPSCLPHFDDPAEARRMLVDPTVGWYRRSDGAIGCYSVAHPPLALQPMRVHEVSGSAFEGMGVGHDPVPVVAGVQRTVAFTVHTPPRRLGR